MGDMAEKMSNETAPLSAAQQQVQLGPLLFSFATFDSWVSQAQRIWRFHEVRSADTVCLDQKGRICRWGEHFMVARDEGAFPVDVYLLRDDIRPNL